MRWGVFGAGSIGGFLGGRLLAAGEDVTLLGRPSLAEAVTLEGLATTDLEGPASTIPSERVTIATDPAALRGCDVVLVTVKAVDTATIAPTLGAIVDARTVVVSFQNGVGNADRLREGAREAEVLAGMVPFNVVRVGSAAFHRGTTGPLVVERRDGHEVPVVEGLRRAGLAVEARADVDEVLWGKLVLNLNNAVNALAGIPLAEELADRRYRRIVATCMREALAAMRAAGIRPARTGRMIPRLAPLVVGAPDAVFRRLASAMIRIDPKARSSMWEDLERGRPTEIDFLQGAIVRLGADVGVPTPASERIVAWVRHAERTGRGSPRLSPADLDGWPP